ncbi:MAG: FecR family protein [Thiomicrospira sp.]|jgi:hypothetical protein|nr:FecR family protein [Thiomicrospira sp.]
MTVSKQITFRPFFFITLALLSFNIFASPIGHVQLIIGKGASYENTEGKHKVVENQPLHEGDIIFTDEHTHLHLKMNDQAYLAVHPNTRVEIICYKTNDQTPPCMKFNLISGQIRKISGQTSKQNPESFRLNTPIAAVGVRGTDFITRVSPDKSATIRVLEGAVTITPFGEDCQPTGLGNCSTPLTALLNEADNYMIKINQGGTPQRIDIDPQLVEKSQHDGAVHDIAQNEDGDKQKSLHDVLHILKDDPELVEEFLQLATLNQNQRPPSQPGEGGQQHKNQTLIFGTWTKSTEGIARPYEEAKEGRSLTVGNINIALWREQGVYQPPTGKIDYNLMQSHAYIDAPSDRINATITNGSLSINFDTQKLDTQLTIVPDKGNAINFSAPNQEIRSDGIFAISASQNRIAVGAVANDGKSAGYMLEQPVEQGILKAQTLWQAKP